MIVKKGDGCWENYNAKHFEIILKFIGKKKKKKRKAYICSVKFTDKNLGRSTNGPYRILNTSI